MAKSEKNNPQKRVHKNPELVRNISEPGAWNVAGYNNAWKNYPKDLDFLSKKSGHYHVKALEKEIYFEVLKPFLKKLKKDVVVLDAACGIGRFAVELAKIGCEIHMVDACEKNLERAMAHLGKSGLNSAEFYLGDISNLSMFENGTFDMSLAIEAICYCSSPEKALKELARVTKKGGLIVISVEGKYGSMIADENVNLDQFDSAYFNGELRIRNHTYTRYFSKEELENMMKDAGIEILSSQGCIYVPNGIFNKLLDRNKLHDEEYKKRLIEIEKVCGSDPILGRLARVWVAIGKVK